MDVHALRAPTRVQLMTSNVWWISTSKVLNKFIQMDFFVVSVGLYLATVKGFCLSRLLQRIQAVFCCLQVACAVVLVSFEVCESAEYHRLEWFFPPFYGSVNAFFLSHFSGFSEALFACLSHPKRRKYICFPQLTNWWSPLALTH